MRTVFVLLVGLLLGASGARAQIYVDRDATGANTGTSWTDAYTDLQTALSAAGSGDAIWVAEGVYVPGTTEGSSFTITGGQDGLELYGGFDGTEATRTARDPEAHVTVLSGDLGGDDATTADGVTPTAADIAGTNVYHVVTMDGTTGGNITTSTVIDGVTITGGQAGDGDATGEPLDNGGGLYCDAETDGNECSPLLRNVVFAGNRAGIDGGAVFLDAAGGTSSPRLHDIVFRGNRADRLGGAMTALAESTNGVTSPVITNAVFANNSTAGGSGGAFANVVNNPQSSSTQIVNSIFWNNSAGGEGGALEVSRGGEADNVVTLTNTTLVGNTAAGIGGAAFVSDATLKFQNAIVWGNESTGGSSDQVDLTFGSGSFAHSIVEGSGGSSSWSRSGTDLGGNLDRDPQLSDRATAAGRDSLFATPDDGLNPTLNSPAIDAGDNGLLPADDLDLDGDASTTDPLPVGLAGPPRIQDNGSGTATVDIGAYEGATPADTLYVDAAAAGTPTGQSWGTAYADLQAAIDDATPTDELWVAEGTYVPPTETDSFVVTGARDGLAIYGGFAGTESVRANRQPTVHRTILSGDLGGDDADPDGDDIVRDAAALSGANVNHVLFLDGTTGGVITNSTVIDGVVVTAGQADGTLQEGGGLYCAGGETGTECSPTLRNVVFSGNKAAFAGGALSSHGVNGASSPILRNVVFAGNVADRGGLTAKGGAIYCYGANGECNPSITNAVFVDNRATTKGGALYGDGFGGVVEPTITNATIVGNRSGEDGGGLYLEGNSTSTTTLQVQNTILWGNVADANGDGAGSGPEVFVGPESAATIAYSIVEGGDDGLVNSTAVSGGPGNLVRAPRLEYPPVPAGTDGVFGTDDDGLHVTPASPAIDAADGTLVGLPVDVTGAPRTQNGSVDLGAYEGGRDPARRIYVDAGNATGPYDGTAWAAADTTLQDTTRLASGALGYATGNDTLRVAAGVYTPQGADTSFTITGRQDGLRLRGGYPSGGGPRDPDANVTVLSGDVAGDDADADNDGVVEDHGDVSGPNAPHVLYLNGRVGGGITGGTVLDGLTVTAGQADASGESGGGLYCDASEFGVASTCSPTLRNVVFTGHQGGAVATEAEDGTASPTIENAVFTGNRAAGGGGGFSAQTINGGTASPTITGTVFTDNEAGGSTGGGAVAFNVLSSGDTANPTITNSVFVDNTAIRGGAIANRVFSGSSSLTLVNVTLAQNRASSFSFDARGGALLNEGGATLTNTILWNNSATDGGGAVEIDGGTTTFDHTLVEGGISGAKVETVNGGTVTDAGGNRSQDPQLNGITPPAGADGRLATTDDGPNLTAPSPAIDAGDNSAVAAATDLAGAGRVQDLDGDGTATVNLGAYETPAPAAPTVLDATVTTVAATTAEVGGTVNPGGLPTTVRVQYGVGAALDSTTTAAAGPSGFVTTGVPVSLSGLQPGTTYNYRVQAENTAGTTTGATRTLTTAAAPPQVTTEAPTAVADTAATLQGRVTAGGDTTRVSATLVPAGATDTTRAPVDTLRTSLNTEQAVSLRVDTLRPNTDYRYALAAANAVDSLSGAEVAFTTADVPPVASDDAATTDEDEDVVIDVLANDTDAGGNLDSSSVAVATPPQFGTATVAPGGTITYAPAPDSNGTDTFAYAVGDAAGTGRDTATVTVTVAPVNDPPTLRPDTVTVRQGGSVTAAVLANDTDLEGPLDTASVAVTAPPGAGTAAAGADGTVTYTHDGSSTLTDTFGYRAADPAGRFDTTTVTVQVRRVALTAAVDTARLGAQRPGQPGDTTAITIENTGTVPVTGLQAALGDGPAGSAADFALVGDTGEETLAPGATRTVDVAFRPEAAGPRRARLTLTAADGTTARAALRGTGVGVTVAAEPPSRGTATPVTVTVEGGFVPAAQATLFARAGGTESYQSVALQPDGGAGGTVTLTGTVPAALATPAGIDYYLVLSDGSETVAVPGPAPAAAARAPRHLPVAFDGLSAEGAFAPRTYRMVSLPVRPDEQGLKEALRAHYGAYDPQTWRLLRWDAAAQTYRAFPELDTLRPGDGAWLVTEAGSTFAVPAGRTVDAGTPYRIPLREGWNQVGVPFGFSVPWDRVQAATGIAPANLDGPVAYRDTSDGSAVAPAYRYAQSTLRPWRGYFVYNGTGGPDTLVVPPAGPDAESPAAAPKRRAARPAAAADSGHYTMRIAAQADGGALRDGQTWIGFRPDARRGRDRHDIAKAPPVRAPYLQVQARAGPAADGLPHAASYQPFGGTGGAWTLTVRARLDDPDATTTVHLHLRDVGTRPPDARRYVLDPEKGRRLAIQNDRVAVEVQSGEPRRLRVLVGTEAFAEAKSGDVSLQSFTTGLSGNYPNPFTRATRIEYQLADRRRVTLAVFNVLGQRVRTLVDEPQDAGGHAVTWEGENRYGRPVGSGVYFVRLTAGRTTKTRKMVLVR